ncbi:TPA: LysE family transporter, partial [Bacillus cereus]|nr:LysE family transporter [Bacillus cereus]
PLTILFWLGIFGSILAKATSSYNKEQLLLYSFGIILGIFIWDITMASTSSIFRKILNTRILSLITVVSGISLIIYGLYFGFQTYQIIFQ